MSRINLDRRVWMSTVWLWLTLSIHLYFFMTVGFNLNAAWKTTWRQRNPSQAKETRTLDEWSFFLIRCSWYSRCNKENVQLHEDFTELQDKTNYTRDCYNLCISSWIYNKANKCIILFKNLFEIRISICPSVLLNTHEIICYNDNYLNWKDVCCHRNAHGKKDTKLQLWLRG